jgi:hypothetical protein
MPRLTRFLLLALLVASAVMPSGCKKAGLRGFCTIVLGLGGCSEITSYTINGESRMRFVDSVFANRKLYNNSTDRVYDEENCNKDTYFTIQAYLNPFYLPGAYRYTPYSVVYLKYPSPNFQFKFIQGFSQNKFLYQKPLLDSLPPSYYWNFSYLNGSYKLDQTDSTGNKYVFFVQKLNSVHNAQTCLD